MVAPLRDRGLNVETTVPVGASIVEIINQVTKRNHGLLLNTEGAARRGEFPTDFVRKSVCEDL